MRTYAAHLPSGPVPFPSARNRPRRSISLTLSRRRTEALQAPNGPHKPSRASAPAATGYAGLLRKTSPIVVRTSVRKPCGSSLALLLGLVGEPTPGRLMPGAVHASPVVPPGSNPIRRTGRSQPAPIVLGSDWFSIPGEAGPPPGQRACLLAGRVRLVIGRVPGPIAGHALRHQFPWPCCLRTPRLRERSQGASWRHAERPAAIRSAEGPYECGLQDDQALAVLSRAWCRVPGGDRSSLYGPQPASCLASGRRPGWRTVWFCACAQCTHARFELFLKRRAAKPPLESQPRLQWRPLSLRAP